MKTDIHDYIIKCMMHQEHSTDLRLHANKLWGTRHMSLPEGGPPKILCIETRYFAISSIHMLIREVFKNTGSIVMYLSNAQAERTNPSVLLDEVTIPWCDPNEGEDAVARSFTSVIPPLTGFDQIVLAINISNLSARFQLEEVLITIEQMQASYNVVPIIVMRPALRDACTRLGFDIVVDEQLPDVFSDEELRMPGKQTEHDDSFAFEPLLN